MVAEESKFLLLEKGSLSHSYESLAEKVKTFEMEVTADESLEQWNFTLSRKKLVGLNYKIDIMTEYWRLEGYLPQDNWDDFTSAIHSPAAACDL